MEPDNDNRKIMNIKVTKRLHGDIRKLGKLGEDYGDVIQRLYDSYVKHNRESR